MDEKNPSEPTPQRQALESPADVLFYGGAAGGGKTDLLIGLALTQHDRSAIFRRTFKQVSAIEERVAELLGHSKGYNSTRGRWRLPGGRFLQLGSCVNLGDEKSYQGHPHDAKLFDEITHFLEEQFRYLSGWNRSAKPGQRKRIVAAGNPPTDSEGEWIVQYWGPWLDSEHPRPAMPGDLRWFAVLDGKDVEVEDGEEFDWKGETITPLSRTFIPSKVEDNPYLMRTGYRATLQALPEPLRSQMLKGDFKAGHDDSPWQVIPTDWVVAAQQRWKDTPKPRDVPMTSMGLDVARGGADNTVISPRYGYWFDEQKIYPGPATPNGPAAASLAVSFLRSNACVQVDVIGIGASVFDHLEQIGVRVEAMNASRRSVRRDKTGTLGFFNSRSDWWWSMREALDPQYGMDVSLPPDRQLRVDLCAPRWKAGLRGIQVETKEETIGRIGRSPDRGDAAVYALQEPIPVFDSPDDAIDIYEEENIDPITGY